VIGQHQFGADLLRVNGAKVCVGHKKALCIGTIGPVQLPIAAPTVGTRAET